MKKCRLLLLLVLCAALLLSGCGTSTVKKSEEAVITIWTSDRSEADVRQEQVNRFNEEHDDITIKYEVKGDDMSDLLNVALQGGTAPDIFSGGNEQQIEAGYVRPLPDDYVAELMERFLPGAVKPAKNGNYYSAALEILSYKMVWNKDLFAASGLDPEAPPKTWAEFEKAAKTITEKGEGVKFGFALPFKSPVFSRYYVGIPGALEGNFNEDGYDIAKGEFDFDMYKPILELYQRMYEEKVLFPSPTSIDNDMVRAQFASGNIGMLMAVSWDVAVFNDQFPVSDDWGVAEMPTFDGEVTGGYPYSIGGSGFAMNSKSDYPEAQLEVYKWLLSDENMKELSIAGKGPFALRTLQGDEFQPTGSKGAAEFFQVGDPKWIVLGAQDRIPAVAVEGDHWMQTFVDIVTSGLDVDETIADLEARYARALEEYLKQEQEENPDFDPSFHIVPDYDYHYGLYAK